MYIIRIMTATFAGYRLYCRYFGNMQPIIGRYSQKILDILIIYYIINGVDILLSTEKSYCFPNWLVFMPAFFIILGN